LEAGEKFMALMGKVCCPPRRKRSTGRPSDYRYSLRTTMG
jgi:hypothetical protein